MIFVFTAGSHTKGSRSPLHLQFYPFLRVEVGPNAAGWKPKWGHLHHWHSALHSRLLCWTDPPSHPWFPEPRHGRHRACCPTLTAGHGGHTAACDQTRGSGLSLSLPLSLLGELLMMHEGPIKGGYTSSAKTGHTFFEVLANSGQ